VNAAPVPNPVQPNKEPNSIRLLPEPVIPPIRDGDVLKYISASRLKTWQTCRRQFFFRYVERIQTPTAPALFVGQQVHEILRIWNWARWKGEPLDREQLQAALDKSWDNGLADADTRTPIPWKKDGDEAKAKAQTWALLEAYLNEPPFDPTEKPEGVEVHVESDLGSNGLPPLIGIIDLVRPGGKIIDFKTAARSPSPRMAALQHATQLACYALLYREATGETESGLELHHLIKTKVPKIIIARLSPMNPAQESHLFFLIDDYLGGIAAEAWIPSPGQHCSWCDYSTECRAMSGF
jgi:putative RecB family exonuclease